MADLFGHQPLALVPPDGDVGREERGAFYTPDALALACARTARDALQLDAESIFEPGCGGGAFLRAAAATWPQASIVGVDLVPACDGPGTVLRHDLFGMRGPFDLVLGNPDFSIAERVVRHCLENVVTEGGILALLLLSSFEESKERVAFWKEYPLTARRAVGFPRPCFRADGQTDMRPYALFIWKQGFAPPAYMGLPPMVWR